MLRSQTLSPWRGPGFKGPKRLCKHIPVLDNLEFMDEQALRRRQQREIAAGEEETEPAPAASTSPPHSGHRSFAGLSEG